MVSGFDPPSALGNISESKVIFDFVFVIYILSAPRTRQLNVFQPPGKAYPYE